MNILKTGGESNSKSGKDFKPQIEKKNIVRKIENIYTEFLCDFTLRKESMYIPYQEEKRKIYEKHIPLKITKTSKLRITVDR